MTGKQAFYQLVEEGRKGHNIGLPIGSKKLENFMDGYLGGMSYLIGGSSGTGKSSYALYALIYRPLIEFLNNPKYKDRDPYWIMFNLEMTREQIYAKLNSMLLFDLCQEQLRFKEIFSRGEDCMLSDERLELLHQCDSFMDELDKRLICFEGTLTEAAYVKTVDEILLKFGKWEDKKYIPNNPRQILGCMIDHCSLIKATNGRSKKDEMDAISRYSVSIRNRTKIFSPIHISQFNRSNGSDERLKQNVQDPNQNDFKDSGALYEDSQVVFALFSPHAIHKKEFHSYKINILEDSFIAIYCLKSRFGTSNFFVPMGFYGDCTHYHELPKPENVFDWEKYKTPYWIYEKDINKNEKDDKKEKIDEKSNFNFII